MSIAPFGHVLKELRKQKRLSQQVVAEKLGVHRNTIASWEQGNYLPESKGAVIELAHQLCLTEQETQQLLEASLTDISPHWLIPYQRNPFFTGRDDVLQHMHEVLCQKKTGGLPQSYALSGLGGIGKTQTALEYTYRHFHEYTAFFWVNAETYESLLSSFIAIARRLNVPEKQEQDHHQLIDAVIRWLNSHGAWLLIFDNVVDMEITKGFLPTANSGSLLFTSRRQTLDMVAQIRDLEALTPEEGIAFLLHRARLLPPTASATGLSPQARATARDIVTRMDGLPLALDQAGAYIEATQCNLAEYLHLFQNYTLHLLDERQPPTDHPASVVKTLSLAFEQLQRQNLAAANLLTACAFLAPDAIPEELFLQRAVYFGSTLEEMTANPLQFNRVLKDLLAYSLIQRNASDKSISIHRLVQTVLKEQMEEETQHQWGERIVRAVSHVFPNGDDVPMWWCCQRYLPHVVTCAQIISRRKVVSQEAGRLLHQAGIYLTERAQYEQAERFLCMARDIRMQKRGTECGEVAETLNRLAWLYYLCGRYGDAEPLYQQALETYKQQVGPDHPDFAVVLNNLALLYWSQGCYQEAKPLYQQALAIQERQLGAGHLHTAQSLNNLALLYNREGNSTEAESLYQRALAIYQRQMGNAEHPDLAIILNNLGKLYTNQGDYKKAEPLLQRALAIQERLLGENHPDIVQTLNTLARLLIEQNGSEEAEPLLQRALLIYEQQMGSTHPHTAGTLNNLARAYTCQGRYAEAEPLFLQALEICQAKLGPKHPHTVQVLNNLAKFSIERKHSKEAETLEMRTATDS